LPDQMRGQLRMPFGQLVVESDVFREVAHCRRLVAIGDVVSLTLLEKDIQPDVLIFDYQTRRGRMDLLKSRVESIDGEMVVVSNPAGRITPELVDEARKAMERKGRTKILVKGEEDLAALVCIALAPSGTCLVYGLPDKGIVLVKINKDMSKKAKSLIYAMEELN